MGTETIEVTGHIVDSLLLAKILDAILDAGCDYEISDVRIGKTSLDPSSARIAVTGDDGVLGPLLDELQVHGANRTAQVDARLEAGRPGRRAARRLLLHHQPGQRRPGRRDVGARREPGDGLRPRRLRRHRPDRAHAPGAGRRPRRRGQRRRAGARARPRPRHPDVRVHGLRGLVREAQGTARRPGGRPAAGGARAGRPGPGRGGPRGGPHRRLDRPGPAGRGRLGRRAVRRATASPPTTSSPTCSAPRSACRCPRASRPRAGTPTTSG